MRHSMTITSRSKRLPVFLVLLFLICDLLVSAHGGEAVVPVNIPFTLTGAIVVGQTQVSLPFSLQGASSLRLDVIAPVNGAALSLLTPDGIELLGLGGLAVQFTSGADLRPAAPLPGGVFVIENITSLQNGTYTLGVTFPAATEKTAILATVIAGSEYEVGIVSPKTRYLSGEDASLGILILKSGTPITGLAPTVKIRRKDGVGVETVVAGKDDGLDADGAASDGIYSVDFTFGSPGTYIIEGLADIPSPSGILHRTAEIEVEVVQAGLTVSQVTAPLRTSALGCIQSVDVVLDANVVLAGDYSMSATLRASNGNELIVNRLLPGIATGAQQISVSFPADDLRKVLAVDGPHMVSQITVIRLATDFEVQYEGVDVLQTEDFLLSEICRESIEIETSLTVVPRLRNGMIDQLSLTFPVYVAQAGSYSISLKVVGATGVDVAQLGETRSLGAGTNQVTFVVPGDKFLRLDGPYSVKSVLALGSSGSAQQSLVGITTSLLRWQFFPTKPGDLNGDGAVSILDTKVLLGFRGAPSLRPGDRRDLNRDGKIDARDVRELNNLIIKGRRSR